MHQSSEDNGPFYQDQTSTIGAKSKSVLTLKITAVSSSDYTKNSSWGLERGRLFNYESKREVRKLNPHKIQAWRKQRTIWKWRKNRIQYFSRIHDFLSNQTSTLSTKTASESIKIKVRHVKPNTNSRIIGLGSKILTFM